MSIHNRYADVPLTEEDFTSFDAQFAIIEQMMSVLQEPDGRILRRVAKIGMKSDTFTRDALMLAGQNEELLPRGLDVQELKAQVKLRDALKSRALAMKLMAKKMEKIVQLLGSDVFSGALAAYKAMKTNHRGTLNEELRELGRIFRRGKKGGEEVELEGPVTGDEGQTQPPLASHDSAEVPPPSLTGPKPPSDGAQGNTALIQNDGTEPASTSGPRPALEAEGLYHEHGTHLRGRPPEGGSPY